MFLTYLFLAWAFGLAYGLYQFSRIAPDWDVQIFVALLYAFLMPVLLPVFALYYFFDLQAERKFIP